MLVGRRRDWALHGLAGEQSCRGDLPARWRLTLPSQATLQQEGLLSPTSSSDCWQSFPSHRICKGDLEPPAPASELPAPGHPWQAACTKESIKGKGRRAGGPEPFLQALCRV